MSTRREQWFALVESNTTGSGREFCRAARARGLRPVVLAADPARYPYLAEDGIDVLVLDTADPDAVADRCHDLAAQGLAGVSSSSEYFVPVAARVAAKLGLPCPDADAIARCRNKDRQREVLAGAGVGQPEFRIATSVAEAVRAAGELGLPAVVKPTAGSGSVGVRLCATSTEVASHAEQLLGTTVNERGLPAEARILVESFADGPEFSVESLDGEAVAVVAKHLGPAPHFVETGHDFPAPVPEADRRVLAATTRAALAALGLGWGAAHTELRLTAAGPAVIEVNPRLAGGMIPAMIRAATGLDLVDAVVAAATGQDRPAPAGGPGSGCVRFVLPAGQGVLRGVHGLDAARSRPGIAIAEPSAVPGAPVRPSGSFRDRVAYVVAANRTLLDAVAAAESAVADLTVTLG
ncbi:ATP-grasp domain-containing protein [Amycolatopsis ultiminotia]|uniref:ATP-grasp domain-containing protein n=1 Tax=Amycolatopsis ultiminotia TaxID=543629 RepID=A0ABP6XSF8_9PSEU